MIIDHPLLGPRDVSEFVYLGDASLINRPDSQNENAAKHFYEYLYLRIQPVTTENFGITNMVIDPG